MPRSVEGWVFLHSGRRLAHAGVEVRPGQTLEQEGRLELGRTGLHASRRAIDALRFARGPVIARVLLEGEIVEANEQACASRRTTLWLADASEVIERFLERAVERAARDSAPELLGASPSAAGALVDRARDRVLALDDALRDALWRAGSAQTDRVVSLQREVGVARARVSALEAHERAVRDGVPAAHGVCEVVSRAIAWNVARESAGEAWERAYADAWNELADALENDLLALGASPRAEHALTSEVVVLPGTATAPATATATATEPATATATAPAPATATEPATATATAPAPATATETATAPATATATAPATATATEPATARFFLATCPDCLNDVLYAQGRRHPYEIICPLCGRVGLDGPHRVGRLRAIREAIKRARWRW